MSCRFSGTDAGTMGRNGLFFEKTPQGGVCTNYYESDGAPLPPERRNETPISKDIGSKRSGDRSQGQTERLAERFVSIVPARSGLSVVA